jgi:multicomponent Na+:H+ antiporter subunit E
VALLVTLWLLAWGEVTPANVVSGVSVAVLLIVAFPLSTLSPRVRLRPLGVMRLVGYVVVQLVSSNLSMMRAVLRRTPLVTPGVLAHRLAQPSEHIITAMSSVLALSPGTMTVDVDAASRTLYVHFLFLHDVDASRAGLERLERLAVSAIGTPPRPEGDRR